MNIIPLNKNILQLPHLIKENTYGELLNETLDCGYKPGMQIFKDDMLILCRGYARSIGMDSPQNIYFSEDVLDAFTYKRDKVYSLTLVKETIQEHYRDQFSEFVEDDLDNLYYKRKRELPIHQKINITDDLDMHRALSKQEKDHTNDMGNEMFGNKWRKI